MESLTIAQAARTTGWSARMLRYVEDTGLIASARSAAGYRLYGAAELQRLRTLRALLNHFEVGLSDLAFAARLRSDQELQTAVDDWLDTPPHRPADVPAHDWLRWEQAKHEKLLIPAIKEIA